MKSKGGKQSKRCKRWENICRRCGLCCYSCSRSDNGEFAIDLSSPCMFLNEETKLCRVYESRFEKYPGCGIINIRVALFHPNLPPSCAYVRKFRPWYK